MNCALDATRLMTPFPVEHVNELIRRYKTHEKFLTDSKTLSEAAKPDKFKESTKWEDWKPTFLNYLTFYSWT
jgi:hypothetical protein